MKTNALTFPVPTKADGKTQRKPSRGTSTPAKSMRNRYVGIGSLAQPGAMSVGIWIGSGVLAILGLVQAVHSAQPLLWLAIWPAPVTLLSTIFIFSSQGFHFRNGVLVLGRQNH
jgi:hypothetical protein